MIHHVKLRPVGRSLGIVIPKAALARLGSVQGDMLTLTVATEGLRLTRANREFAGSRATFASLNRRYHTALRTLGG
jgi:antitoxin component of MazEF toxin-antitoxin module